MKKIMNRPDQFVEDSLQGILYAHAEKLRAHPEDLRAIVRADAPARGKVAIVTGGGYGHLPLFLGYVGPGACDGVAVGNVFTSPSCESIVRACQLADGGEGILFLFGNYMGDQMNFEMAGEMLSLEGIRTETIRAADDVASAPRASWQERRGIAGIFFAYWVAGAKAGQGASLDEVASVTRKACARIATIGVAFSSCQLPESAQPIFSIEDGEMELGMGIHGEKGISRCGMMDSAALAKRMTGALVEDLRLKAGSRIAVLVNGLGSTSREELYILTKDVFDLARAADITVERCFVGEYVTSMEMAGASLTFFGLDDELSALIKQPVSTPFVKE